MADHTALVTDGALPIGLTVARSLARSGWRVVTVDTKLPPRPFRSRHVDRAYVVPSAERDPRAFCEATDAIACDEGVDLIFPTSDTTIMPLSRRRSELRTTATLLTASDPALRIAANKHCTQQLAASLGIPTPPSRLVSNDAELDDAVDELGLPVVVKPMQSHSAGPDGTVRTRSVTIADDLDSCRRAARGEATGGFPVQLQAHVSGHGVGVELLVVDGETRASFQHLRMRELPLRGGMSSARRAVPVDPVLLDASERLLAALRWEGIAMVEYRITDDGPRLLEINGRPWGSLALAVRAGVDFPRLAAAAAIGHASDPTDAIDGTECRSFRLELLWAFAALVERRKVTPAIDVRVREIAATLVGLVDPRNNFDLMAIDDPMPGAWDVATSVRELVQLGAGRLRRSA